MQVEISCQKLFALQIQVSGIWHFSAGWVDLDISKDRCTLWFIHKQGEQICSKYMAGQSKLICIIKFKKYNLYTNWLMFLASSLYY